MRLTRKFSKDQKRRVVEEALSGQTSKSAISRKYNLSYSLLLSWIEAYERGHLDTNPATKVGYAEKIAILEQMVGKQAMEIEFLKKVNELTREQSRKKERLSKKANSLSEQPKGGVN